MTRQPLRLTAALAVAAALGLAGSAAAQFPGVTLPPSGGNQRQTVIQQIGLVRVSVDYSSPHVHSPSGEDRKGKIWGKLVPYGMANLGFGSCGDQCPLARRRQREHGLHHLARHQGPGAASARRHLRAPLHPGRGRMERRLLEEFNLLGELLL